MGLSSGIKKLDKLIGFIPRGKVVFVQGLRLRKHILELFCLRSITQYQNYCIFIDGANSFDPYLLSKLANIMKQNPKEVLNKIILSRAFTCHQLASLILHETEIIERFPTHLIAISDLLHLFKDPESDIENYEVEIILTKIVKHLNDIVKEKNVIVVITSDFANEWLSRIIESYSDIVLTVKDQKETVHISLDKHEFHPNGSIQLTFEDLTLQNCLRKENRETIEPWLMAYG